MSIETRCTKCNKGYRVGDDKAGMRFRCKQCGAPVSIPQAESEFDDFGDDWGDGGEDWGASPYGAPMGGGQRSSSSGGSKGKGKKKSKKKSGSKTPVIIASVGGVVVVAGLVIGGFFLLGGDDDKKDGDNVAQNNNEAEKNPFLDQNNNGGGVNNNGNQNNPGFNPNNNNPGGGNQGGVRVGNVTLPANMPNIPAANLPPLNGVETRYTHPNALGAIVLHPNRALNSPLGRLIPQELLETVAQDSMDVREVEQMVMTIIAPQEMAQLLQMFGQNDNRNFQDPDENRFAADFPGNTQPISYVQPNFGGGVPQNELSLVIDMMLKMVTTYVRYTKDQDPAVLIPQMLAEIGSDAGELESATVTVQTIQGKSCFVARNVVRVDDPELGETRVEIETVYYMPDKRTLIFATQQNMNTLLSSAPGRGALAKRLQGVSHQAELTVLATLEGQNDLRQFLLNATRELPPQAAQFASLPRDLNSLGISLSLTGSDLLSISLEGVDANAGGRLAGIAQAIKGLASLGLVMGKAQVPPPQQNDPDVQKMLKMADELVAGIKVNTSGNTTTISAPQPKGLVEVIEKLVPEIPGGGFGGPPREFEKPGPDTATGLNDQTKLKQIGLAFHNFHDTYKGFSPAVNPQWIDSNGEPHLSWRVHLLPFLEQRTMYNNFDVTKAYNESGNERAGSRMPSIFQTPGVTDPNKTTLHVFTGPGTLFEAGKMARLGEVRDGSSNTILAVVAGRETAVGWIDPLGLPFDPDDPKVTLGTLPKDGFWVIMCDGSIHKLPADIDNETLKAMITPNGGETVTIPR